MNLGWGISNGVWDVVFKTRFPENVRLRLSSRKRVSGSSALNIQPEGSDISSTRTFSAK
jgi:hypothetical protein